MKKTLLKTSFIALFGFSFLNANAFEPTLNKEYVEINQAPVTQKEVVEFFSFYCPHCYNFEEVYEIPKGIKEQLSKDIKLTQYHVSFLGKNGKLLTQAWSLAMALGVEDKVRRPLFDAVQKNNAIHSMEDIKKVFVANGISEEQFDNGINSFLVNGLTTKQENLAETFSVKGVPSFFINNKYEIKSEGFSDSKSNAEFIHRYIDTVISLSNK